MVERNLAKVEVASSRLVSRSKDPFGTLPHAGDAGVAQLVERNLAKVEVASSRLVSRSRYKRRETLSSFPFFVCGPRMTELVDVADLKSAAPKRAYGFDSRFWDQTKIPSRS